MIIDDVAKFKTYNYKELRFHVTCQHDIYSNVTSVRVVDSGTVEFVLFLIENGTVWNTE
jgi:hypothetical protein